jgi:hypothetical protein
MIGLDSLSEKVRIGERGMIRLFQVAINKNSLKRIAVDQALITSKTRIL